MAESTTDAAEPSPAEEAVAAAQHTIWAHWMRYMFTQGMFILDGWWAMPPLLVERWLRQAATPYAALSEAEKQSDRDVVREFSAAIVTALSDRQTRQAHTLSPVLHEVQAERLLQDARWGDANARWGGPAHDDSVIRGWWVALITSYATRLQRYRASKSDAYRADLLQVAALAVAAIESYDRQIAALATDEEEAHA